MTKVEKIREAAIELFFEVNEKGEPCSVRREPVKIKGGWVSPFLGKVPTWYIGIGKFKIRDEARNASKSIMETTPLDDPPQNRYVIFGQTDTMLLLGEPKFVR